MSMARKDESIINLLVESPWWVSVLVSVIAFVFLKFIRLRRKPRPWPWGSILPSIAFKGMAANSFARGLSVAAPFVALALLLPAPISAFQSWRKQRLLDGQKSLDSIRGLNWRRFWGSVGEGQQ